MVIVSYCLRFLIACLYVQSYLPCVPHIDCLSSMMPVGMQTCMWETCGRRRRGKEREREDDGEEEKKKCTAEACLFMS